MLKLSWSQALAWRMQRHFLDPISDAGPEAIAARLCGIQAQVASSAEQAIRVRSSAVGAGDVGRAIADGRLIKTWAMRGTLHLLAAEHAGTFLALMVAGRSWERPAWQRYLQMDARNWDFFRETVCEALAAGPMTREEIATYVCQRPALEHLGEELRSGWGSLLKPLAWHGDLCFGPAQGNRVTFMRPEDASALWRGVPDVESAAPAAIVAYLGAYGPATVESFSNWISRGRIPKRQLKGWFAAAAGHLAEVEVNGETQYIPAELLDGLAAAEPSDTVRLLPGFDQWVLGPGTDDANVIPPGRRFTVSKQSGWIAPLVVKGGLVCGIWQTSKEGLRVSWFGECGEPPQSAIESECERAAGIFGDPTRVAVDVI